MSDEDIDRILQARLGDSRDNSDKDDDIDSGNGFNGDPFASNQGPFNLNLSDSDGSGEK